MKNSTSGRIYLWGGLAMFVTGIALNARSKTATNKTLGTAFMTLSAPMIGSGIVILNIEGKSSNEQATEAKS